MTAKIGARMVAIIPLDNPSPAAFENVYEKGDRWEKLVGCENCQEISRCCGTCPLLVPKKGCLLHLESQKASRKPYNCIIKPTPDMDLSWCQQVWLCVRGKHKGKIRRIREPANVFHNREAE